MFDKKQVAIGLTAILICCQQAVNAQEPSKSPLNQAFVNMRNNAPKALPTVTSAGYRLGKRPTPFAWTHLRASESANALQDIQLPASFDLRALNRVTAVRNQNPYGTCWAFAALASVESCLMPGETNFFSVNQLVKKAGFDSDPFDGGGGANMAAAYLTRWAGPINDSDDPYPNTNDTHTAFTVRKHIQNVVMLPLKANPLDNNIIKLAVMQFGALDVGMFWDDNFYNDQYKSLYYNGSEYANHAVDIVGWDDDFPAGHFSPAAPGNGAFIVRNSWGTEFGDGGYFYCSYYDTVMGHDENVSFPAAEATDNYAAIYQYDPLGLVGAYGFHSGTMAWGANVFTATANQQIAAAGFYALDANIGYTIKVYTHLTGNDPATGVLQLTQTGHTAYAGFYTVDLEQTIPISQGEKFAVVVGLPRTQAANNPIAVEYAEPDYSSRATAEPNQSFISPNGSNWTDTTTFESTANVCIKAYAANSAPFGPQIKANGLSNLTVTDAENVAIIAQMNADGYSLEVDWWLAARAVAANGTFMCYMDADGQWQEFDGNPANCRPIYMGPMCSTPQYQILNTPLPVGAYTFWFAVDYPMNGILQMLPGQWLCGTVNVTVLSSE